MPIVITRYLAICTMILVTHAASAAIIVVEPDDFTADADIRTAFQGVTLSVEGQPLTPVISGTATIAGGCGGSPEPSTCASTGTRVFGRPISSNGDHWQAGIAELRADFAVPTDFVSIDLAGIDDGGARVRTYSTSGSLLDTFLVDLSGPGDIVTAAFYLPTPDISYIVAGGMPGESNLLDNLQFNLIAVPEPPTLALFLTAICVMLAKQIMIGRKRVMDGLETGLGPASRGPLTQASPPSAAPTALVILT